MGLKSDTLIVSAYKFVPKIRSALLQLLLYRTEFKLYYRMKENKETSCVV